MTQKATPKAKAEPVVETKADGDVVSLTAPGGTKVHVPKADAPALRSAGFK